MNSKLNLGRFVFCCLLFALPAAAQLDSAALRAKYGAPLNRETFHMPQGFHLTVDYGAGHQVCKLEVPAEMPPQPNISGAFNPRQRMQDFLSDLVPSSIRGKEKNRLLNFSGAASALFVEYENVTVVESRDTNSPQRDTINVRFMHADCRNDAGH
jgi:hypothetical protein